MEKTLIDSLRGIYRLMVFCENCGNTNEITIPKGVLVTDYLNTAGKCPNCGTISLHPYIGNPKKNKQEINQNPKFNKIFT